MKIALSIGLVAAGLIVAVNLVFEKSVPSKTPMTVTGLWVQQRIGNFSEGQPISVPPGKGAKLVLDDGTALWLDSSSQATPINRAFTDIVFNKGRLLAAVAKQKKPSNFRVRTPSAVITVRGTVFSIAVRNKTTLIRLYQGKLDIDAGNRHIALHSGQQASVSKSGILTLTNFDRASVIEDLMITETTSKLGGPPVPSIGLEENETETKANINTNPTEPHLSDKAIDRDTLKAMDVHPSSIREKKAESDQKNNEQTIEVENQPILSPEVEAINIESQPSAEVDEKLFNEAYLELQAGHHHKARKLLEQYLEEYPNARYWQHVKNILGE